MAAFGTGFRFFPGCDLRAAILAIPDGNAVSPPELPGDTPVADILHPIQIDLGKALGDKTDLPVLYRFNRRGGQRLHLHKPLLGDERFNHGVAAVAGPDRMGQGSSPTR